MKKKVIYFILIFICLIAGFIYLTSNREYPNDDNTLYTKTFDNKIVKFERYDYSLGQNQIVGVEESVNEGKTYEKLTSEPIVVSNESKFIFLDKNLGFVISTPNLNKLNDYIGLKVTQDGGKTFVNAKIHYDNPDIEILTLEDFPYKENGVLKLPCSIYQIKKDDSGYEDVKLIFISTDNGLTWNLLK